MPQTKIYDGDVSIRRDGNHTYYVSENGSEEKTVPGVTSVTDVLDKSGPLMGWAVKETVKHMRNVLEAGKSYDEVEIEEMLSAAKKARWKSSGRAMSIGKVAHEWIEDYIKASLAGEEEPDFPENEQVQESIIEFLDWEEKHDVEWLASEQMVYHNMGLDLEYAGTFDAEAFVDDQHLVIDFKTSKGIYDSYYLQAEAYRRARSEENGEVDGFCILRIPKDQAEFEAEIVTDEKEIAKHWDGFIGALTLYIWKQNL